MMAHETIAVNLTEIEYRVLSILRENARTSVSEIADRLGVSRATVSRAIRSLINKGIRFTVDVPENSPKAFIITSKSQPELGECYRLVDDKYLVIISARDYNELIRLIDGVDGRVKVFIALGQVTKRAVPIGLVCDYCGGPISVPIIYRRGRRTYYLCCETCLRELKKKLSRSNKNKADAP
ncbi:transcriptional regulator, TrmB [Vulcanisaeta moutnovskia 768-28]|uniref:Transcriptional regulator, TrmB n=2 Tax=Vulcanisaeta TaxID=164450 RepID=F0QU78_VULM7|nr:transcriptional regulator, TrmB [Vulcanisaeta moutnovskia 768-28]